MFKNIVTLIFGKDKDDEGTEVVERITENDEAYDDEDVASMEVPVRRSSRLAGETLGGGNGSEWDTFYRYHAAALDSMNKRKNKRKAPGAPRKKDNLSVRVLSVRVPPKKRASGKGRVRARARVLNAFNVNVLPLRECYRNVADPDEPEGECTCETCVERDELMDELMDIDE